MTKRERDQLVASAIEMKRATFKIISLLKRRQDGDARALLVLLYREVDQLGKRMAVG